MAKSLRRQIRPFHRALISARLTQVVPIAARVVLPGETMDGFQLRLRYRSDAAQVHGWPYYVEHALIYVPLSAINGVTIGDIEAWLRDLTLQPATTPKQHYLMLSNPSSDWLWKAHQMVRDELFKPRVESWTPPSEYEVGGHWRVPVHYADGRHYAVPMPDLSAQVDADASGTVEAGELIQAWHQLIEAWRRGEREQSYETYLQRLGIRVPGVQTDTGSSIEVWAHQKEFLYVTTRFDVQSQSWASYLDSEQEWRRDSVSKMAREPGYLLHYVWYRPSVYHESNVGYASAMRHALYWQPDRMMADVQGVMDSHVPPNEYGYASGSETRKIHAHMPHVVGESLVGRRDGPTIGLVISPTGTIDERLWPSMLQIENPLAGTGNQFYISCEAMVRYRIRTTCAWPFIGPVATPPLP